MRAPLYSAYSAPMNDAERGSEIQRRLDALGISDREFQEQSGIDRKTLRRAVSAEERVRPSTYDAIEAALTKLEQGRVKPGTIGQLIELRADGVKGSDFEIRSIIASGPIEDPDALAEAVARLIERVRKPRNGHDD